MDRNRLAALVAFSAVAREKSFTRAAVELDLSPSAVSHSIKTLEAGLGVGLLTRTTRSVGMTEAGERLICALGPALDDIELALDDVLAMRSKPAGTIRITAVKHAVSSAVLPILGDFLVSHPDISIEFCADDAMTDVVAAGFDAGVRLGERVDWDMIAIRISPEIPTALVAAPTYFERHPAPASPRDLAHHRCIGHRMGTGGLHSWPFVEDGRSFHVSVGGGLVFDDSDLILSAALEGHGLGYLFADEVELHLQSGRLVSALSTWTTTHPGYYFYYPSRRQQRPALSALVDHLRARTSHLR